MCSYKEFMVRRASDYCLLSPIKRKRPQHPYHDQIQINNINPKMMAVGEGFEPPRSG